MDWILIVLTFASALAAYQFFLWLYTRRYRPKILIGILPHYEIMVEGKNINFYGRRCIASEFIFNPLYFARDYNIDKPDILDNARIDYNRQRKIIRSKEGNCQIPIIIQNLGKGFSKDLLYVVTFYEKQGGEKKKSHGKITIKDVITERPETCYAYLSDSSNIYERQGLIQANTRIVDMYEDVDLLADYIYFESSLEPKAFVLNILDMYVESEVNDFIILFNIFSLQNEKMLVSKFQHCTLVDTN